MWNGSNEPGKRATVTGCLSAWAPRDRTTVTSVPPYRLFLMTSQPAGTSTARRDSRTARSARRPVEQAVPRRRTRRAGRTARGRSRGAGPGSAARRSRTTSARSSSPRVASWPGWRRRAAGASSTKTTDAAPREIASMPMAPLPANRSTTAIPSRSTRLPRMSKIASRTRSDVGRVAVPARSPQAPATAVAGDHTHGRSVSGAARGPLSGTVSS